MALSPSEITSTLSDDDQKLLNEIFNIELKYLHRKDIKNNSRIEKIIISEIESAINSVVTNDN